MTSSINPQEIRIGRKRILYDGRFLPQIPDNFFNPQAYVGVAEVHGQALGRGEARFFEYGGQNLVLRHCRRGGFVRHFVADRYFGIRAENSRSFREWRLLADLYQQGFPVPRPVAASFCPAGLVYRADLVTRQIEKARPLSIMLQDPLPPALWSALGTTLRRFHDAQIFHADLNAHNILLDQQAQAYLIDFDRGAVRAGEGWKQANLNRLLRSLQKLSSGTAVAEMIPDFWQQLQSGYGQSSR
jgi:3-deoxy-D-manno-octulosonic acid kinase